jgi:bifunctional DNA-binding transcriptional regulator/antitoxin component of YhaV-PrlF toxin-antitoxin module
MNKNSIKLVEYGTNSLQIGGRIQLPKPLINTLDIKQGQEIAIYLDVEKAQIILKAIDKKALKK